jgi:hypothetical protein
MAGVLVPALPAQGQAAVTRADAVVLVNSSSTAYQDFAHYIQPYLDHFGVPYTIVDVASTPVPSNLQDYALIIIGHNRLDPQHIYLSTSEQLLISSAVSAGSGLLNFDSVLADASFTPYYQYAQTIFGFGYAATAPAADVAINSAAILGNYVVAAQTTNVTYTLHASITPLHVSLSAPAEALATLGGSPFLIATTYGQGRAIQWTSYDWMHADVWGAVRGFDDLIWRGIVWAARKPFVMQGLPPFVTMRVDDVAGPLWWVDTANQYGWKPWGGLFYTQVTVTDTLHLKSLVDAGDMTVSTHSKTYADLFYMGCCSNFPDTTVDQNFAEATAWFTTTQIPISKYVVPHYYRFGSNVFTHLRNDWGVEFVGTVISPSLDYFSAPRLMMGPFNQYETACGAECSAPIYYADYLTIPGHPELNGQFFNLVTEIRDITGYEWTPDYNVEPTVARGVTWLKRALDGMDLATLMTHEDFVLLIPPSNWNEIMAGVTNGIAAYQPEYVTMDYAAQYVRAMHTSNISSSVYNPVAQQLSTTLTGTTDMPTRFYLFTEAEGAIRSRFLTVPVFTNSVVVNYSMTPTSVTLTSLQAAPHSTEVMWSLLVLVIIGGLIILIRRR